MSLLLADTSVRECLESNKLELLDPSVLASLQSCGMVTDGDELARYRFNHNTALYNTTISSFLIFTTYACNLACPYCYEGMSMSDCSSMSRKTTANVVRFIGNQAAKNKSRAVGIALYGGEPLLNMECCIELLHSVSAWCTTKKLSFSATLMSNGTLLDENVYATIKKYVSYIHITLDGPQHFHDKTRSKKDGSGSYWQILSNLNQLANTKEYLHIRINIDEESMDAVDEVLTDLETIGLKGRPRFYIYFSQIIPQKYCFTISNPEWDETKVSTHLPVITEMAKKEGWGAHLRGDPDQKLASAEAVSCGYVKCGTYTIDPGGDIYVCPALTQNPQYRTGTISDHPVWYPLYYDILTRDPAGKALCSRCEFLPLCKGGCPVFREDNTQCGRKEQLYQRLKAYLEFRFKKELATQPVTSQVDTFRM
jgi:uncharacterized protein